MTPHFLSSADVAEALDALHADALELLQAEHRFETTYRDRVTVAWLRDSRRQAAIGRAGR
ncbi:MAG: hypothetical protein RIC85_00700 [Gammaproteobacteria bacterium]|jgi:hypothetical protein